MWIWFLLFLLDHLERCRACQTPGGVSSRNWICQSELPKRSGLRTRSGALALLLQELPPWGGWTITFRLCYPFTPPLLHSVLSLPCLSSILQFRRNVLALTFWDVAHSVGTSSCGLKGHGFNSQSGHVPRVWVWFLVVAHAKGNRLMFLSLSLPFPSPLKSMGAWVRILKRKQNIFLKYIILIQ